MDIFEQFYNDVKETIDPKNLLSNEEIVYWLKKDVEKVEAAFHIAPKEIQSCPHCGGKYVEAKVGSDDWKCTRCGRPEQGGSTTYSNLE